MATTAMMWTNGKTIFSKDGQEVPKLSKSWIVLYAEFLEQNGVDPTTVDFKSPHGHTMKLVKGASGWTCTVNHE